MDRDLRGPSNGARRGGAGRARRRRRPSLARPNGRDIDQLAIPSRLFVDPNHRHRSVATVLIRLVPDYGRDRELKLAFDVMLKDRNAIRLYEALGCIRLRTVTHRYGNGHLQPASVYALPTSYA